MFRFNSIECVLPRGFTSVLNNAIVFYNSPCAMKTTMHCRSEAEILLRIVWCHVEAQYLYLFCKKQCGAVQVVFFNHLAAGVITAGISFTQENPSKA